MQLGQFRQRTEKIPVRLRLVNRLLADPFKMRAQVGHLSLCAVQDIRRSILNRDKQVHDIARNFPGFVQVEYPAAK